MKKLLFCSAILVTVFISGCKKDNETDYASAWVGVYNNPSSVPNTSTNASLNNIIISKVNGSTLKVQMKALETSYVYTYTTLQSVSLNGVTVANIDEVEGITEATGQYHIKGTLTMTGNTVTLSATATNMQSSKEADVITMNFSGNKKQ